MTTSARKLMYISVMCIWLDLSPVFYILQELSFLSCDCLVTSTDDLKSRVVKLLIPVHWPGVHKRTEANVSRVEGFIWNLAQCYLLFLGTTILHLSFSSLLCLPPTSTYKTTKGFCLWLFPFLKGYLNSFPRLPTLLSISCNEIHQTNHSCGLGLLWMSV